MTDYEVTPGVEIPQPVEEKADPQTGTAEWDELKSSLDDLASSLTKWATAVRDDPENRRQARELKERLEQMGRDMGKAIDTAAESDLMRDLGGAAGKAGEAVVDAARAVGREVRPFMATAFRAAAESMRVVAQKVDDSAARKASATGAATPSAAPTSQHAEPSPTAAPYCGEEPPSPAPSGTPGHVHISEPDPGQH